MELFNKQRVGKVFLLFAFLLCLLSNTLELSGQKALSWKVLADVTFSEKYDEEMQGYWLIPEFGKQPKALENQTVVIGGYYIPVDTEGEFHVLSRYPYSSCFFCGGAGPESIVELQFESRLTKIIPMDTQIRVQGVLVLNNSDFGHCNYILKDARLLN